ncbi:MAG: FeoA family protein [Halothiobacillaceae bacterium]
MRLGEVMPGQRVRLVGYIQDAPEQLAYRRRLMAMGIIPGTTLTIERIAPLGDPVEVRLRGYALSLRRDEAAILEVEAI